MADNPLAFPSGWPSHDIEPVGGMLLRDWFAGQALMACSQSDVRDWQNLQAIAERLATASYMIADAMLTERERT